jgi:hypothetical protein
MRPDEEKLRIANSNICYLSRHREGGRERDCVSMCVGMDISWHEFVFVLQNIPTMTED